MKKIEKVSIADISFTLDSDAYSSLKQYLDSLHAYYDEDPDGGEIIADIEARIAELILNEQVYTKVVSQPLIDTIIAQLGTPEEIGDDDPESGAPWRAGAAPVPDVSIPRRLHRSAESRILGGVCSGMARYFDINVAWIRIAFLFPVILVIMSAPTHWHWVENFFQGWSWVFLVTYVVLWIALPIARTPRQKLESRGEKITPSSIRQNLQETAHTPSAKKAASVAAEIFTVLGRILLVLVKFIVAVIGFSLLITAFGLLVLMIATLVNPVTVGIGALTALPDFVIISPLLYAALLLLCVMLPMFIIGTVLLAAVFGRRTGRTFFGITIGLWLLAMVFCIVVTASNARYLRGEYRRGNLQIHHWGWSWDDDRDEWREFRHDGEWRREPGRRRIREIRDAFDTDSTVAADSVDTWRGKSIERDSTRLEIRIIE